MDKTPWQLFKEKTAGDPARPWDFINPKTIYVKNEVSQKRLEICLQCEHFFKPSRQCKKCGCLMDLKTRLAHSECPIGKWKAVEVVYNDKGGTK